MAACTRTQDSMAEDPWGRAGRWPGQVGSQGQKHPFLRGSARESMTGRARLSAKAMGGRGGSKLQSLQTCALCNDILVDRFEGLRARKQRQTRDAIHRAAVELALKLGPEGATVAGISALVNISPRTFFNYYPTKEDAIVGLHEKLPSDDELEKLRSGTSDDLIGDILSLMVGVFTHGDARLLEQRNMLMTENPQLIQRQWARMIGVEQRLAGAVADRLRARRAFDDHPDIDNAALALVVTCNAVLRLSIRKVTTHGSALSDIQTQTDATLDTLREVLRTLP